MNRFLLSTALALALASGAAAVSFAQTSGSGTTDSGTAAAGSGTTDSDAAAGAEADSATKPAETTGTDTEAAGSGATGATTSTDTAAGAGTTTDTTGATTEGASATGAAAGDLGQMRADDLLGKPVVNAQGEEIGTIEDLVINPDDKVVLAVVSAGGFLGMGEENVAVRFDELQMQGDQIQISETALTGVKDQPAYEEGKYESVSPDATIQEQADRLSQ